MNTEVMVAEAPLPPALDWEALVAEGHRLLGAMSDGRWTDFNAHDPGITIMEAFAFALTDLGYRTGHPIPDLMAGGAPATGRDAALAGTAVTRADLRRAALAVSGVGEAWVEPAIDPMLRLRRTGNPECLVANGTAGEVVALRGVARMVDDRSPQNDRATDDLVRGVGAALHRARGLGEDWEGVVVLPSVPVAVAAEIEIDDPGCATPVLAAVHAALAAFVAPAAERLGPAALRAAGWREEAIREGPATGGVRPPDDAAPPRRAALHLSDAIALLSAIDGVRRIRDVRLGIETLPVGAPRWSVPIPADRAPRFDPRASRIRLIAGGVVVIDAQAAGGVGGEAGVRRGAHPIAEKGGSPPGRDRDLAAYRSLADDLPAAYGVGEGTLPPGASPERRADAAGLAAYLSLLDGLLVDRFDRLGATGALLSPVAAADDAEGAPWRNRLLAHLLARQGEEAPVALPALAHGSSDDRVGASRSALLTGIARLTSARGTGADLLDAEDEPALLDRIRVKAGLIPDEGTRMRLVEHVLLRPTAADDADPALLADVALPDPYSLQVTLVVDDRLRPGGTDDTLIARVARAETPAHLVLDLLWLDSAAFDEFADAYRRWRRALAALRRDALGMAAA